MAHIRDTTSRNVPVLIHRGDEMLCTTCNWSPHDVSAHGELCANGHPVAVVGTYPPDAHGYRRCRACQRATQRKHDAAHRERNRARWRAWWARTHASPEVTPRDNGDDTGERSVAGPGAAAVTVAPTTIKAAKEAERE